MEQAEPAVAELPSDGSEDEVMQDVDLASVPSSWVALDGIAAGEPGINMEDGTNVDATRLTGCFVGKEVHNRTAQEAHRRSFHILGQARDRDSVLVVVVRLRNDTLSAFHVGFVYNLLSSIVARQGFNDEREVLRLREKLATHAYVAEPELRVQVHSYGQRLPLKKVTLHAAHISFHLPSHACIALRLCCSHVDCCCALRPFFFAQELMRLKRMDFLSRRQGFAWTGTAAELTAAYEASQPAAERARRAAAHRAERHSRNVRARPNGEQGADRGIARNLHPIFAHEEEAHDRAAYDDMANLGDKKPRARWGGHPATPADAMAARCMCTYCGALLYRAEAVAAPTIGVYGTVWCGGTLCCSFAAVQTERVKRDPAMEELWADEASARTLVAHARQLNNAMALASNYSERLPTMPGSSSWRPAVSIEGRLHHRIGPLLPSVNANGESSTPAFAQVYVHDPATPNDPSALRLEGQAFRALGAAERLRVRTVLATLHRILTACNRYVQDVMTAGEIFLSLGDAVPNVVFAIGNEVCTAKMVPYSLPIPYYRLCCTRHRMPMQGRTRQTVSGVLSTRSKSTTTRRRIGPMCSCACATVHFLRPTRSTGRTIPCTLCCSFHAVTMDGCQVYIDSPVLSAKGMEVSRNATRLQSSARPFSLLRQHSRRQIL